MIRVCPKRDAKCPHGMSCPYAIDRYSCHEEKPGYEMYNGKLRKVVNADRQGWYRFHNHYDRNGYCDNPARGY